MTTVASGSLVSLTASVVAGTTAVTTGQVIFCDATATYCTDIHVLGTVQLTSAGSAVLKFRPGPGSRSYKAVFLGTPHSVTPYAGSTSSTGALAVTGLYPTVTTIAQSGFPGDYTLTATVAGTTQTTGLATPTGTVSFHDSSYGNTVLGTASLGTGTTGLSFMNSQTVATGSLPWSVASGDFNRDGIPDLAVANYGDGTVTILLGNGNGTFTQATGSPLTAGFDPYAIVVGDFNQDGKDDLAIADNEGVTVTILLGNGDGTFYQATNSPISVDNAPNALAVGDFNGDGILDLAVASGGYGPGSVTILLGNGDGTFSAAASGPVTVGLHPISIAAGDFNGDGVLDLATANWSAGTVTILLGNGSGAFTQAPNCPVAVGSFPSAVSVADSRQDGKLDLAVANSAYTSLPPGAITVLLGNGDGTFAQAVDSPVAVGDSPESEAFGDFNGDGIPDLAVANNSSDALTFLIGNGDGTFTQAVNSPVTTGDFPQSVAVADFIGGGISDVAVVNEGNDVATVLLSGLETASATVNAIAPVGATMHLVDASYPGDSNYSASVSGAASLVAGVALPVISPGSGPITSTQYIHH